METLVKLNVEKSTIEKLKKITKKATATKATRVAIEKYPEILKELERCKEELEIHRKYDAIMLKNR